MDVSNRPTTAAAHRFAPCRHYRLAYDVSGPDDGGQVLLLHDLLAGRFAFGPVRDPLSADDRALRLIVPDARGHGASAALANRSYGPADLITEAIAVLDAAGAERVTVVGHGLGGTTALLLAMHAPERVEALVLLSPAIPSILADDPDPAAVSAADEAHRAITEIGDLAYQQRSDRALNRLLDPVWESGWRDALTAPQLAAIRRNAAALSGTLTAIASANISLDAVSHLRCPLTIAALPGIITAPQTTQRIDQRIGQAPTANTHPLPSSPIPWTPLAAPVADALAAMIRTAAMQ